MRVGYRWLSRYTVGPAAFWKCVFLGHPVYIFITAPGSGPYIRQVSTISTPAKLLKSKKNTLKNCSMYDFLILPKIWYFFIIKDIGSEGDNMSFKPLKLLLFFGHRNVFTFKIVKKSLSSNIQTWSLDVKACFALELFCSPTMSKKILLKMQFTHFKRFNIWIFFKTHSTLETLQGVNYCDYVCASHQFSKFTNRSL